MTSVSVVQESPALPTKLPPPPPSMSLIENHQCLSQVWRQSGMTKLRDLLTWYNRDTRPKLSKLWKQCDFAKPRALKDDVSVPGLTLRYLCKTKQKFRSFSLSFVRSIKIKVWTRSCENHLSLALRFFSPLSRKRKHKASRR